MDDHQRATSSPAAALGGEEQRRYRRLRVRTFILSWLCYATYYLCRKNFSIAKLPLSRTGAKLDSVQLGNIDTAYLTTYAIGQFPNGVLGDRIGAKWLVVLGLCATATLNLGMGIWPGFSILLVLGALNGGAQSTGWPGCTKAFSKWFAVGERGTAMGIWCTCYTVGGIVATLLATWANVNIGWRAVFLAPAAIVAAFVVVLVFAFSAAPADVGLPDVEHYYAGLKGRTLAEADIAPQRRTRDDIKHVLASGPIWMLGLTYMTLKFVRYSLLFWAPLYMQQQLGYDDGEAGYTSVAFETVGFFGPIVAGIVSDRFFAARRPPVVVLMMGLLTLVAFSFFTISTTSRLANVIVLGAMGFFVYGPDSVVSGVAAVDYGGASAGSAAGFVNALGSVGGALSGVVVGRVKAAYGWSGVFNLFGPICLAGTLLMATLLRRPRSQARAAAPKPPDDRSGK